MNKKLLNTLALNRFLNSIDDVILREEVLEHFHQIGKQGVFTDEDKVKTKDLLTRANVSYEDFERLVKQFRR